MNREPHHRGFVEGAIVGLLAGSILVIAQMIAAAVSNVPVAHPWLMPAAISMGPSVFDSFPTGTAIFVGALTHAALSVLFGFIYGAVVRPLPARARSHPALEAALGMTFGAAVWAFNFLLVAPRLYPWFLTTPAVTQALLHVFAFGLPLGLLFAGVERRIGKDDRLIATLEGRSNDA